MIENFVEPSIKEKNSHALKNVSPRFFTRISSNFIHKQTLPLEAFILILKVNNVLSAFQTLRLNVGEY